MRILAIETSCDETGAAVVERKGGEQFVKVLSNVTATSSSLHAKTGGIIPEFANLGVITVGQVLSAGLAVLGVSYLLDQFMK